jgi:hypothetical protein
MKESHRKGVANHPDPESSVGSREAVGEALTGAHAGWVLSCEIIATGVPTFSRRKATPTDAQSRACGGLRAVRDPMHVWKLHAREPGGPIDARCGKCGGGPVGEGVDQ